MAAAKKDDLGVAEVQKSVDAEEAAGLVGVEVDPTPNAHYTVAGVTAGKPTPETDHEHAAKVRAELDNRARKEGNQS
jgi:hypothetical protein